MAHGGLLGCDGDWPFHRSRDRFVTLTEQRTREKCVELRVKCQVSQALFFTDTQNYFPCSPSVLQFDTLPQVPLGIGGGGLTAHRTQ